MPRSVAMAEAIDVEQRKPQHPDLCIYANHGGKKNRRPAPAAGRRRTEGHGNRAVNDGEERERVRGEKVGGRNDRLGSREGRYSSARSAQLAERGPSGSRRPSAKMYTTRHTKNSFCFRENRIYFAS
jgi:hypothetical protein